MRGVYLIHFDTPFGHAEHYTGYADWVERRVQHNMNGTGSNLCRHVAKAGIPMRLVRVWKDKDRTFERKLKNRKKIRQLCPECRLKDGIVQELDAARMMRLQPLREHLAIVHKYPIEQLSGNWVHQQRIHAVLHGAESSTKYMPEAKYHTHRSLH